MKAAAASSTKSFPANCPPFLQLLEPYKDRIATVAIESTYNWYWLADGLQDHGYPVVLANPARMKPYDGLKHTDDVSDAYFLTELLRLGILPTGHLYDRKHRPVRDLLRRRLLLVRQRTSLILSFKSLNERTLGQRVPLSRVKAMSAKEARARFTEPADQLLGGQQIELMGQLQQAITKIEQHVLGVADAGNFASYCRCVKSLRQSNGKKKGENNRKCGNRYLAWAFVEAAHFACRYDERCRRFYDRKAKQTNPIIATKALACKLAKAAWHVMKDDVPFDAERVFGPGPKEDFGEIGREPAKGSGRKSQQD